MRHRLLGPIAFIAAAVLATTAHGDLLDEMAAPVANECTLDGLFDEVRAGISTGSPAYRRYLRRLVRDSAAELDEAKLLAAFSAATDPALVEELAAALAARTDRLGEPAPLRAAAARAVRDPDPAVRAAITRALQGTSALEHAPEVYVDLVRDRSPAVREQAAENLVSDLESIYAGQHAPAADAVARAAFASDDPQVTAQILGSISTAALGSASVQRIHLLLRSDSVPLRAAAATALGGVSADESEGARAALVTLFAAERDLGLRRSIVESVVRLARGRASADLERFRQLEPRLALDIDEWFQVLALELQEWSLLAREKQRLEQARR
jgi:hypothetical protein